jgi:hypothetical protein
MPRGQAAAQDFDSIGEWTGGLACTRRAATTTCRGGHGTKLNGHSFRNDLGVSRKLTSDRHNFVREWLVAITPPKEEKFMRNLILGLSAAVVGLGLAFSAQAAPSTSLAPLSTLSQSSIEQVQHRRCHKVRHCHMRHGHRHCHWVTRCHRHGY